MSSIGIFYGSSTGNTKMVAEKIHKLLPGSACKDISETAIEEIAAFDVIILGSSTWGTGDIQDDWEAKLGGLKNLNLKGKKGAVFGTGDQEGYADSFCDAVGILKDALLSANASLIGSWPADGYTFDSSKASETDNSFAGLVIDEDNQSGVTDERIAAWVSRLAAAIG